MKLAVLFMVVALGASACSRAESVAPVAAPETAEPAPVRSEVAPRTAALAPAKAAAPAAPRPREVTEQDWTPFATVGGVTLRHPSSRIEVVAFHEANHDGARQLVPMTTDVDQITLETRERQTGSRSAADVVADPDTEIRSPVTGRVKRGGTYVLYCKHSDDFVVIEPDAHPGWEVKVLHIDGLRVRAGDRVVAGQTVLAPGPTRLPFESQVDEVSAKPTWPHVHLEIVDPSIPDRPSPDRGCA